jgi:hypothetical protein
LPPPEAGATFLVPTVGVGTRLVTGILLVLNP